MPQIEILRTGTFTAMNGRPYTFAASDLEAIAASYDPANHEAPAVIGHPEHNGPAWGWVKGLEVRGDRLVADLGDLHAEFTEMVRAGRFRKVSASLYPAEAAGNPTPGKLHLRHVGFLGATPPAVKGLGKVELGEDADCIVLEFGEMEERAIGRLLRGLREWMIGEAGTEVADRHLPAFEIEWLEQSGREVPALSDPAATPDKTKEPDMDKTELEERERALAEREAALNARDAAFSERERQERRAADGALLDGLVREGKLPQGKRDEVLAFMDGLDGAGTVEFGESGKIAMGEAFRKMLGDLPAMVSFGETAGGGAAPEVREIALSEAGDVGRKAGELQRRLRTEGTKISISEAVERVRRGEN